MIYRIEESEYRKAWGQQPFEVEELVWNPCWGGIFQVWGWQGTGAKFNTLEQARTWIATQKENAKYAKKEEKRMRSKYHRA